MILASSEQRPEMLLTILEGIGQLPTTGNYLIQSVSHAAARKP